MSRTTFRTLITCVALTALSTVFAHPTAGVLDVPPPMVVTFAHINDVYEIDAVENGAAGGLARVATIYDRLKRSGQPVVTTLGGDFLSPSAIGTARINGEALAGRQMVDVLNAIGVQWATFGNHEFDLSEAQFRVRLSEAKFKLVVSNVTDASGRPFPATVTSAIVPVRHNGRTIRLGLMGLVTDFNRTPWVKFSPPVDAARVQVDALRGKVDAIVALTHLSLAQDQDVVEAVPEIDLVLGGHEHENWLLRRGRGFTPIVKADANARSVAIVTMRFGAGRERPDVSARFELVDARVPFQPRAQAVVRRWVDAGFDAFRRDGFTPELVVATVPASLDGRETTVRNRPGNLSTLIAESFLREAKDAALAIMNGGSIRIDDVLQAGPVRQYDLIRILPFGGKVLKVTMDGALLSQVLDAGAANLGSGGFLHLAGGAREESGWMVAGKPVDPAARYNVAMPEFLLTGGEARLGFLKRDNPQVRAVQELRDIRLVLMDELRARYGGGSGFFDNRFERVAGASRE